MEFTLPQTLWELLTNPNVVYALLIVGMWSLLAAFVTPGTGIPESVAVVCLTLAIIGLWQLPTNAAALLLIVVAVILYLVEVKVSSHGFLAFSATVLLVVGSLFLFHSGQMAANVSIWLIAVTALASLGLFWLVTAAGLAAQLRPVQTGARVKVGDIGRARTDLKPSGVVYVADEEWSARSAEGSIAEGTPVKVIAIKGLHLVVVPARDDEEGSRESDEDRRTDTLS